ncbi:glycosyltransferase [bacterium BMS3Abin03]|nr:glycosyltransferase [bacterium BMS3Abin03]MCG6958942.1 glycosyltransferase [bacterium BMS3Abin03]
MKIAIVHEWFAEYAGSERVVESFTNLWPDADVFALVDLLNEDKRRIILKSKRPITSFIQKMPFAKTKHRYYLPLFPLAIERFDFTGYDIIISSSHAVTKGLKKTPNQLHISYCHSPMRYAWDNTELYLDQANISKGLKGFTARKIINYLRKWDLKTASRPDFLIANSKFIAGKIKRIYNREADVIYPPVDVNKFDCVKEKGDYFLTASRMVPYKRVDLMVEAFSKMTDKKLKVVGQGSEFKNIKNNVTPNIELLGYKNDKELKTLLQKARAFVFAAEEDFGITVVEAMACGTPVIALNKGGTAETVIDSKTGILFNSQNVKSIKEAVLQFEDTAGLFNPQIISDHARQFNREIFEGKIKEYVREKSLNFFNKEVIH